MKNKNYSNRKINLNEIIEMLYQFVAGVLGLVFIVLFPSNPLIFVLLFVGIVVMIIRIKYFKK